MSIRKPAADGNGVLWVKDVRCRGVVDDDSVLEVATNLGEILGMVRSGRALLVWDAYLDVVPLMVVAAFAEKPVVYNAMNV